MKVFFASTAFYRRRERLIKQAKAGRLVSYVDPEVKNIVEYHLSLEEGPKGGPGDKRESD